MQYHASHIFSSWSPRWDSLFDQRCLDFPANQRIIGGVDWCRMLEYMCRPRPPPTSLSCPARVINQTCFSFYLRVLRWLFHVCLRGKGAQISPLEYHVSQGQTLWESMKIPWNHHDAPWKRICHHVGTIKAPWNNHVTAMKRIHHDESPMDAAS